MTIEIPSAQSTSEGTRALALDRVLRAFAGVVVWSAILFLAAGHLRWARGWFYVALYALCLMVGEIVVSSRNPALLAERAKRHNNTKSFDKVILPLILATFFVLPVVAGLDAGRYGWTHLGRGALLGGLPLYLAGSALVTWCMLVNAHLEVTVRLQEDRGHRVVQSGPYAIVRHPMHLGVLLQGVAAPLLLGSLWAFVPVALTVLLFVVRTALEDGTLREELPGYEEYAARTRFRLVPGLW